MIWRVHIDKEAILPTQKNYGEPPLIVRFFDDSGKQYNKVKAWRVEMLGPSALVVDLDAAQAPHIWLETETEPLLTLAKP